MVALALRPGRVEWIDAARGLGICLVAFGHAALGVSSHDTFAIAFVHAFHMPLFFFLTGCADAGSAQRAISEQLIRNTRRLVVPYAFFSAVSIAVFLVAQRQKEPGSLPRFLGDAVYGVHDGNGAMLYNGPLWFFTCLFSLRLVVALLRPVSPGPFLTFGAGAVAAIAVVRCSHLGLPRLPWNIDVAVAALPFYLAGQFYRSTWDCHPLPWRGAFASLAVCATLAAIAAHLNGRVDMSNRVFGRPELFFLGGFSGIAAAACAAQLISRSRALHLLGAASLVVFSVHLLWLFVLPARSMNTLAWYVGRATGVWELAAVAVAAVLIALSLPVFFALRRFAPALIGEPAPRVTASLARPGF